VHTDSKALQEFVQEYLARVRQEARMEEEAARSTVKKDIRSDAAIEQNVTTHDDKKIEMSTALPATTATAAPPGSAITGPPGAGATAPAAAPPGGGAPIATKNLAPAVNDDITSLVWGRQRDAEVIAKLQEELKRTADAKVKAEADAAEAVAQVNVYKPMAENFKRTVQETDERNAKRLRTDWEDSVRRTKERFAGIDEAEAKPHIALIDEADKKISSKFDEIQKRVSCGEESRDKMQEFSDYMQNFSFLLNANNIAGEIAARSNEIRMAQMMRAHGDNLTAQVIKTQAAAPVVSTSSAPSANAPYVPTLIVPAKEAYAQEVERKKAELKSHGDKVQELLKGKMSPADALKAQQAK
jgi:hypothetical protein